MDFKARHLQLLAAEQPFDFAETALALFRQQADGIGIAQIVQRADIRAEREAEEHQGPVALELVAMQFELELALAIALLRITLRYPHAAIPDDHIARAVMPATSASIWSGASPFQAGSACAPASPISGPWRTRSTSMLASRVKALARP